MKKRILIVMMSFIMMVSFIPLCSGIESFAANNPYSGGYSNCTWTAWQIAKDSTGVELPAWGNAKTWYASAAAAGYSVGSTPRAKSIVVYGAVGSNPYGHVAYVADYNSGTNQIYVKEGGYNGAYHEGWTPVSPSYNGALLGFIYLDGASHNPIITFDSVDAKPGRVHVRGWTYDPDNPSQSIDVHVYMFIDGNPYCIGGVTANAKRQDVDNVFHVGAYHGFDATFDAKAVGPADIKVAAINIGSGDNVWSGAKQVNLPDPNPIGNIDRVDDKGGSIYVAGWAYDLSDTSKTLDIHVYIGGPAGTNGAECHIIKADVKRTDVNKAFGVGDYHGYSATIQTNKTGSQPVYIYGINVDSGWHNTCFGNKTVTITKHTHVWDNGTVTKTPTCKETGIKTFKCTKCGATSTESIGLTDHNWGVWTIKKKATSSEEGVKERSCNVCGEKQQEAIPKTMVSPETENNLPTVAIKKVTAGKKLLTVKWKKLNSSKRSKISGIQIQYSTDKTFNKSVKSVKVRGTKTSKKIKKLKSRKSYYIRIRTYKNKANETFYSNWSKVRRVKIK